MTPFTLVTGRAAVVDRANIDTDQIIPARFLRRPRSDGYQNFLFADLVEVRASVLGASVLLAGANFGCGSSREGAVYALVDAGVRCVIAPGFGDIFAGNAGKNGLLLLSPGAEALEELRAAVLGGGDVTVDLVAQRVSGPGGAGFAFEMDPFRRRMLLEGLDEIGLTLADAPALEAWAARDADLRPWAAPAGDLGARPMVI